MSLRAPCTAADWPHGSQRWLLRRAAASPGRRRCSIPQGDCTLYGVSVCVSVSPGLPVAAAARVRTGMGALHS